MDTKVIYNKGVMKNGNLPDNFDGPPDWETNQYSDEEDVFMESQNMDLLSATKPLMYQRTRTKIKGRVSRMHCRPVVHAVACFLFLVLSLGSLMGVVVYFVNKHNSHRNSVATNTISEKNKFKNVNSKPEAMFSDVVGCDDVDVEDVWVVGLPKLLTESAFRLVDVNSDGTPDVILGFATGVDGYSIPSIVCDIYFQGTYPCFGGLIALEGNTGKQLWRHYTEHEIYGLNCDADLNEDGVADCLAGGRAGAFQAVSGKDGLLIWDFVKQEAKNEIMNLYTAQILPDIDEDGVVDILAIHGGDPLQEPGSAYRLSGRILIMSGKTGKVLNWMGVPDRKESYFSPQTYTLPDGTVIVLFGTGGETHGGSLWKIRMTDLIRGDITQAQEIYTDKFKGVMTPPVIADITGDGVDDIILPAFNSSVLAFDGLTAKLLWNHTFPGSESYNTPSPGFYNDDDIPDFLVRSAYGPGFPIYYHSETTVLDGKTGKPLIDPPIRDTVGAQASPLTVSMEGHGNDLFLYWAADCKDHVGEGGKFQFVDGTNVHEQSRSDFCRLRFKTKGYSKIYALNSRISSPGETIYYSEDRMEVEHNKWINTTQEGIDFVISHPEYIDEYHNFKSSEINQKEDFQHRIDKFNPNLNIVIKMGTGYQFLLFLGDVTIVTFKSLLQTVSNKKFESIPIYRKEGTESLFETPTLNSVQRTSYKKGPAGRQNRPSYLDRMNEQSGYDFTEPNYQDPYASYSRSALNRNRKIGGRLFDYSRQKTDDASYFTTTPDNHYQLPQYRNRYPSSRRNDRLHVKERHIKTIHTDNGTDTKQMHIKPIAMRERRTRKSTHYRIKSNHRTQMPKHKVKKRRGKKSFNFRSRRHVGPHDEDGLQRLLSTGTLAPSTLPKNHPHYNHSIDFLFATYWFFPAKTRAILPQDQACIENKMIKEEIRFDPKSDYYGMDHDAYEHTITDECLSKSHHDLSPDGTFESQTQYNPFNVHMGQMTVYRVRLTCTCANITSSHGKNKMCAKVLPFEDQQWIAYMGNKADSHWRPRNL